MALCCLEDKKEGTTLTMQSPTAAAPKLGDTGDWADMTPSSPTSPLGGPSPAAAAKPGKKKLVKTWIKRPATMIDIRKTWKPFGLALDPGNEEGLTVKDGKPVPLELGTVDPLEKAVRDELASLMYNSQSARVEAPLAKHLAKLRAQHDADNKEAAAAKAAKAAAPAGPAPPVLDAETKKGMTWAQAKEARAAAAEAAKAAASGPGGPSGAEQKKEVDRTVVRVSNLTESISLAEIHRLFGPENGLGKIQRVYVAKDKDGGRRGFCYITYGTAAQADACIAKMHRCAFRNVILLVDHGTVAAGGGGGGGGGRGNFPPR